MKKKKKSKQMLPRKCCYFDYCVSEFYQIFKSVTLVIKHMLITSQYVA